MGDRWHRRQYGVFNRVERKNVSAQTRMPIQETRPSGKIPSRDLLNQTTRLDKTTNALFLNLLSRVLSLLFFCSLTPSCYSCHQICRVSIWSSSRITVNHATDATAAAITSENEEDSDVGDIPYVAPKGKQADKEQLASDLEGAVENGADEDDDGDDDDDDDDEDGEDESVLRSF